jgi:hypothetical protein
MLACCNRRLESVLHSERSRRLDGLFVAYPEASFHSNWQPSPFVLSRIELRELFGEGQVAENSTGVGIYYYFVEVAVGNEGVHSASYFHGPNVDFMYQPTDLEVDVDRFVGWLRRLHEQWLTAQQGEANGGSSGVRP